jgi:DNA-binding transcriptional MerR regulator
MARYLTVAELADKCSPGDKEREKIWLRRIRHWSSMGSLPPAPASREGTGHHRRYTEDTLYLAAVLLRIADLGISVSITKEIAECIHVATAARMPKVHYIAAQFATAQELSAAANGRSVYSSLGLHLRECWRQARSGKPAGSAVEYYLCVWLHPEGFVYVEGIGPDKGLGSLPKLIGLGDAPLVLVSLTQIFAAVRD